MDFTPVWDQLVHSVSSLPQSGLLMAAFGAMLLGVAGSFLLRPAPVVGRLLRGASTLGLMGILVLVVLQLSRVDTRFDLAVPEIGLPEQVVEGRETRVRRAPDGHYWIRAEINGHPANFLVDTGATLTAISGETAAAAGLEARAAGVPVRMQTANGAVAAELTSIDELRFGNVVTRGLDAVIAPGLGPTNVVGMNFLSRLASVRLEGDTMVLVPHNPQPALPPR
ncbi:MAG TPA: TIGR02281 family clan AA aspartic protease [Croceibacterium sp.]|nr:TIGR02281 family clan AA aspartic protease [Croceibacterium sp.]